MAYHLFQGRGPDPVTGEKRPPIDLTFQGLEETPEGRVYSAAEYAEKNAERRRANDPHSKPLAVPVAKKRGRPRKNG